MTLLVANTPGAAFCLSCTHNPPDPAALPHGCPLPGGGPAGAQHSGTAQQYPRSPLCARLVPHTGPISQQWTRGEI